MGIAHRVYNSLSSTLQDAFSWFKTSRETGTTTKYKRRIKNTDFTEGYTANEELTKGVYFGDYPGLKLASPLAMPPIKIPVYFQGIPAARTEEEIEEIDGLLEEIIEYIYTDISKIHIQRRREGTVWAWPWFDREEGRATIKFISDNAVKEIIKDPDTGKVKVIITDEEITLSVGYNLETTIRKRVTYTQQRIITDYQGTGRTVADVQNTIKRNVLGILPVPFSFEADGDEVRGHSVYSRIIGDLKAYHDTDYAEAELLAKFKPKLTAGVKDVEEFAKTNGYDDSVDFFTNFDLAATDILLYLKDKEEKPEVIFPERATQAYSDSLKRRFRKIVEGTGIPEIAWGLKTEGNMASVEENMATLLMYVRGDQVECEEPWKIVFEAMVRLEAMARMIRIPEDMTVTVQWNDLEAISDKTKAEVFKNFADGISALMDKAALTKQQLFNIWQMNFPKATEEEYEEFVEQIWNMAKFRQYASSTLQAAGTIDGTMNVDDFDNGGLPPE